MEQTLRDHLFALRDAYCGATKASPTTVAQAACGDWRFWERVGEAPAASFRIRTYDRARQWFSDRWPAGIDWPADVPRPAPAASEQAA